MVSDARLRSAGGGNSSAETAVVVVMARTKIVAFICATVALVPEALMQLMREDDEN
jgi:hypothetical protein